MGVNYNMTGFYGVLPDVDRLVYFCSDRYRDVSREEYVFEVLHGCG